MKSYSYMTINPPGSVFSDASGINNKGEIVADISIFG